MSKLRLNQLETLDGSVTVNVADLLDASNVFLTEDLTVDIPTDYPSMQAAVDALSRFSVAQGVAININLESGYEIHQGLNLSNGNYSHFNIISEAATVLVDDSVDWFDEYIFNGVNCQFPRISCLVNCQLVGKSGIHVTQNSSVFISPGCGAINAGEESSEEASGAGLFVRESSVAVSNFGVFTGASRRGIWITRSSLLTADNVDCSNCEEMSLFVSRGSTVHVNSGNFSGSPIGVRCARSYVSCRESNITNCTDTAILCFELGTVSATSANLNGSEKGIVLFQGGGFVSIERGTAQNIVQRVVQASGSCVGSVNLFDTTLSSVNNFIIEARNPVTINANNTVISGGLGIQVGEGCVISLDNTSISGSAGNGVKAQDGATVSRLSGSVTGSTNDDVAIDRGGIVTATNLTTSSGEFAPVDASIGAFNTLTMYGIVYYY